MEINFSKREKRLLKLAEDTVGVWKNLLLLDPIWRIDVNVFNDENIPDAFARVDTSTAEYFFATLEISFSMFQLSDEEFEIKMNEVACHELIHLVLIDYFRTAQISAGKNEVLQKELRYKFEQATSRLQKSFIDLYYQAFFNEIPLK